MWRAYGTMWLLTTDFFALLWVMCRGLLPAWWLAVPFVVLVSCALHEAGHLLAALHNSVKAVVVAKFGYAAVVYKKPRLKMARIIAVCGPIPAALACLAAALFCGSFLKWIFVMTAMAHLYCLLPFAADGKLLWRGYEN